MTQTLGVIVAGGEGRRLGLGVPKPSVQVGGRTLLERMLETAGAVCDEVVVTAPGGGPSLAGAFRRVTDVPGHHGPLAGLVAGLRASTHRRAIGLAVDLPLLGVPMLRLLLERLPGHAAVVPAPGGVPQPLAAVYDGGAASILAARLEAGEQSVTAAVMSLDPLILGDGELESVERGVLNFLNVNSPADLAEAERRLALLDREVRP